MAEPIQVSSSAAANWAQERTLQKLLQDSRISTKILEDMALQAGVTADQITKLKEEIANTSDTLRDTSTSADLSIRRSLKDLQGSLLTSYVKASQGLFQGADSAIGSVGIAAGLTAKKLNNLGSSAEGLSRVLTVPFFGLASLLPLTVFGLTELWKTVSDLNTSYQTLYQSGLFVESGLSGVVDSAGEVGISLATLTNVFTQYGNTVASLGTNKATRLAKSFTELNRTSLDLGLTNEEATEAILQYSELMRNSGSLRQMSDAQLIQGTQEYYEELNRVSAVTGKNRKEIEKNIESQVQHNLKLQTVLRTLPVTAREGLTKALVQSQMLGKEGSETLIESITGFMSGTGLAYMSSGVQGALAMSGLTGTFREIAVKAAAGQDVSDRMEDLAEMLGDPELVQRFKVLALSGDEGAMKIMELVGSTQSLRDANDKLRAQANATKGTNWEREQEYQRLKAEEKKRTNEILEVQNKLNAASHKLLLIFDKLFVSVAEILMPVFDVFGDEVENVSNFLRDVIKQLMDYTMDSFGMTKRQEFDYNTGKPKVDEKGNPVYADYTAEDRKQFGLKLKEKLNETMQYIKTNGFMTIWTNIQEYFVNNFKNTVVSGIDTAFKFISDSVGVYVKRMINDFLGLKLFSESTPPTGQKPGENNNTTTPEGPPAQPDNTLTTQIKNFITGQLGNTAAVVGASVIGGYALYKIITSVIGSLAGGLGLLAGGAALKGAAVLLSLAGTLKLTSSALSEFNSLNWTAYVEGAGTLGVLAAAMYGLSLATTTIAPAIAAAGIEIGTGIGAIALSLVPLGAALYLGSYAIEAFGNVIKVAFEGASNYMKVATNSILELSNSADPAKLWELSKSIGALGLAFASFSTGGVLKGISTKISEYFGVDAVTQLKSFTELADPFTKLSDSVKVLKDTFPAFIDSMGKGEVNLSLIDGLNKLTTVDAVKLSGLETILAALGTTVASFNVVYSKLVENLNNSTFSTESISRIETLSTTYSKAVTNFGKLIEDFTKKISDFKTVLLELSNTSTIFDGMYSKLVDKINTSTINADAIAKIDKLNSTFKVTNAALADASSVGVAFNDVFSKLIDKINTFTISSDAVAQFEKLSLISRTGKGAFAGLTSTISDFFNVTPVSQFKAFADLNESFSKLSDSIRTLKTDFSNFDSVAKSAKNNAADLMFQLTELNATSMSNFTDSIDNVNSSTINPELISQLNKVSSSYGSSINAFDNQRIDDKLSSLMSTIAASKPQQNTTQADTPEMASAASAELNSPTKKLEFRRRSLKFINDYDSSSKLMLELLAQINNKLAMLNMNTTNQTDAVTKAVSSTKTDQMRSAT